jgi:hypothetical protein
MDPWPVEFPADEMEFRNRLRREVIDETELDVIVVPLTTLTSDTVVVTESGNREYDESPDIYYY